VTNFCQIWDGNPLGPGPLAVAAFPRVAADANADRLALVVAGSEERSAVVVPGQVALFLKHYADAELLCCGAAELHWLFVQHLRYRHAQDAEAMATWWWYSREARLTDLSLLDQQVRRFRADAAPAARSLAELAAAYAGISLSAVAEVCAQATAALADPSRPLDLDLLASLAATANALLTVRECLWQEAEPVLRLVAATNRPLVWPRPTPAEQLETTNMLRRIYGDRAAVLDEADEERSAPEPDAAQPVGPFGLFGVGVAVQGAIARTQPRPPAPPTEAPEREAVRAGAERAYADACTRLHREHGVRGCFRWNGHLVVRDSDGVPGTRPEVLRRWLRQARERLCDLHGYPADTPGDAEGQPCVDPERWGVWAAADPTLRAWRDMTRAARLLCWVECGGGGQPDDAVALGFWERPPNLLTLRPLAAGLCRPRAGHVLVEGRLDGLNVRCWTLVCRIRRYTAAQRLFRYILRTPRPLEMAAAELYAEQVCHMDAARQARSDAGAVHGEPTAEQRWAEADWDEARASYERATHGFAGLRRTQPRVYAPWMCLTQALLETLPLGLPPALQQFLLKYDFRLRLGASTIDRFADVLGREVAYELGGYREDDTLEELSKRLGVPLRELLDALPLNKEHWETQEGRVRNDLGIPSGSLCRLLGQAEKDGRGEDLPPDPDLAGRWLKRSALTLAGRVTPPAFCAAARRAECEYAVEEVRAAVAYELVASGHNLAAWFGDRFVLEVDKAKAAETGWAARTRAVVQAAGVRVLGSLAPPCRLRRWNQDGSRRG
jgi:hypothetical protein